MSEEAQMDQRTAAAAAPPPIEEAEVSSVKLILTLGVAGALAGLLLVFVYNLTLPRIEAHKAKVLQMAVGEVLKGPERYDTLYVVDGGLSAELPAGENEKDFEKVFYGFDAQGKPIGFAIVASESGFQDKIKLIFGFDPVTGALLGMKVLESKETPGLGDKIEKDPYFVNQFDGIKSPLVGVKKGKSATENDVEMITGATISSRAVIRILNNALERVEPLLQAYVEGGTQ